MKKFILSLCALCIAGLVSAQIAPINPKLAPRLQKSFSVDAKRHVNASKYYIYHDTARYESAEAVVSEPYYNWDNMFGFNWIGNIPEDYDYNTLGFCKAEEFDWVYGTGGFPTYFGSGEIGYRFAAGYGSYYALINRFPEMGYPYAAIATIVRCASTASCMKEYDEDGNFTYKKMPVYFKLYNSTKMAAQQVPGNVSGYSGDPDLIVDVVYPADPEDYTAKSAVYECEVIEDENYGWDGYYPAQDQIICEFFENCDELLGKDFGLSLVFPVEFLGDDSEEGEMGYSLATWRWNAFPMYYGTGISTNPHCTYTVIDWNQQCMFGPEGSTPTREKPAKFENGVQTNPRYSVIPMDSWYWSNESSTDAEPYFYMLYTDEASIKSANHADRYVQVSPNPAVDYVNFSSFGKMQKIEIFSMTGKLVKTVKVNTDKYNMNISDLNSGMYVARITGEKGISTKKMVVK